MDARADTKVFTVDIPLRWGDMDAYGHINNVTMMRILEEARIAVLGPPPSSGEPTENSPRALLPIFETFPSGVQALVAENHLKYRAPLPYRGQPARIKVYLAKATAASLTIAYDVYDAETGQHCVSASTVLAFFMPEAGSIVRLSKDQRQMISEFIAD
ncbi:acyl-CoA thioesterase [Rothia aerolata]|uniref:Thioesterase n=1 Tax=Rothia aerolata TaxID=1812262 RepID=A0A917IVW9_9MICC|nr:acyl-CoA thioesterase [Rothia aerolata]GGH65247.1 thioesterase [Rothia aerolata]